MAPPPGGGRPGRGSLLVKAGVLVAALAAIGLIARRDGSDLGRMGSGQKALGETLDLVLQLEAVTKLQEEELRVLRAEVKRHTAEEGEAGKQLEEARARADSWQAEAERSKKDAEARAAKAERAKGICQRELAQKSVEQESVSRPQPLPAAQSAPQHGQNAHQSALPGQMGAGCVCEEETGRSPEDPPARPPPPVGPGPTKEQAAAFLESRAVLNGQAQVLVMANRGNRDLVDNLLCSLKVTGVQSYLLFAADIDSFDFFQSRGYAGAFYDGSVFPHKLSAEALEIQNGPAQARAWADLLRARVNAVKFVLSFGYDVLFTDADVVFSQPGVLEGLQEFVGDMDAAFMWDGPTSGRMYPAWANAGYYFMRSTSASLSFIDRVLTQLAEVPAGSEDDDQTIINKVLVNDAQTMQYRLLDNTVFVCGHTLKTHVRWPGHKLKKSKGPAYVSRTRPVAAVHVNWTGSLAEKKRLLLSAGYWHMCSGMGPQAYEQHLKDAGQWFNAESFT